MILKFKTDNSQGLEQWICQLDGKTIAKACSLPGVRSMVMQLIKHTNWEVQYESETPKRTSEEDELRISKR